MLYAYVVAKTTTLRLFAGSEQPTAGRILLDGVDMSGVPPHKRNVNTVFQSYALFPFLSVFDNVAFGLRHRGISKTEISGRVHEALDLVRLRSYGLTNLTDNESSPAWCG